MDERQLVERLIAIGWKGSRNVALGPGDDAAVLRGGLVLCNDLMVEDVHFRSSWISPREVGFRAGVASLSDLAAMGAQPVALLVGLAVTDPPVAEEIQRGVRQAGERAEVYVVGGDVSRSPGPSMIDVVAVGRTRSPVRRAGAQPGQALWVSGSLGGAATAVAAWSANATPSVAAKERFACPPNRSRLGRTLATKKLATAMIDISDGLLGDADRLARASQVSLSISERLVPVDADAGATLDIALLGGEDYELLFTAETEAEANLNAIARELSVSLTKIGAAGSGKGIVVEGGSDAPSTPTREGSGGFDHFGTATVRATKAKRTTGPGCRQ